jgi:uncharacterized surface protein with fasciclin (FAS1) repeats
MAGLGAWGMASVVALAALGACAAEGRSLSPLAAHGVMPRQTVVEAVAETEGLHELTTAIRASGLASTLSGAGPFTVFAPNDKAFDTRRKQQTGLDDPSAGMQPAKIVAYHVLRGRLTSEEMMTAIRQSGGKITLQTLAGRPLSASLGSSGNIMISDERGAAGYVVAADTPASNGVVHVINNVLQPTTPGIPGT